jgi:hypothetical protein
LGDPAIIFVIVFLVILIPAIAIYWIIRLARHELNRRKSTSLRDYLVILRVRMPQIRSTV